MNIVLTRPRPQLQAWRDALRLAWSKQLGAQDGEARGPGLNWLEVPLVDIAPVQNGEPLHRAWQALLEQDYEAVVFVSPNAVEHFSSRAPRPDVWTHWPQGVWAAGPGQGTLAALHGLGLPAECLVGPHLQDEAWDSEALWARLVQVRPNWQGCRVLVVRGNGGRPWLAEQLQAAGARVDVVQAYSRHPCSWQAHEWEAVRASRQQPSRFLWVFSHSQGIETLQQRVLQVDMPGNWGGALATHARIGATAAKAGFSPVNLCMPSPDAVAACIQCLSRQLFPQRPRDPL
jgi:uroporphyrinogen-III synthase